MLKATETMLSHQTRERKYARAVPARVPVRLSWDRKKIARKGERIEAGSVRIDSIGRPIRNTVYLKSEEIARHESLFSSLGRKTIEMIDASLVYRGTVHRGRFHLISFGVPFSSGDPLPATSIY